MDELTHFPDLESTTENFVQFAEGTKPDPEEPEIVNLAEIAPEPKEATPEPPKEPTPEPEEEEEVEVIGKFKRLRRDSDFNVHPKNLRSVSPGILKGKSKVTFINESVNENLELEKSPDFLSDELIPEVAKQFTEFIIDAATEIILGEGAKDFTESVIQSATEIVSSEKMNEFSGLPEGFSDNESLTFSENDKSSTSSPEPVAPAIVEPVKSEVKVKKSEAPENVIGKNIKVAVSRTVLVPKFYFKVFIVFDSFVAKGSRRVDF
jgi:hypothetical protein